MPKLETYPNVEALYEEHEEARFSVESDFGVWWKDDQGGTWRVSYVHATGQVYAASASNRVVASRIRLAGEVIEIHSDISGPVIVLGTIEPSRDRDEAGQPAERGEFDSDLPADGVLDGWAEMCGKPGSLAWALERVRAAGEK